jgi:hypothetical protein
LHNQNKVYLCPIKTDKKMENFNFKLLTTTKFKNVAIDFYSSTEGYFVETSQGLVSDYFKTKKEATKYIANAKRNIKLDAK